MIKEDIVNSNSKSFNNASNINLESIVVADFDKLTLPSNLREKIKKIDHSNFSIENFSKFCQSFLKFSPLDLNSGNSVLHFDLQPLHQLNIVKILNSFSKDSSSSSPSSTINKGLILFVMAKYLTQLSDVISMNINGNQNSDDASIKKLNEHYSGFINESEVFSSYRHKILNSNLSLRFENILKDKEEYRNNFTFEKAIEEVKKKLVRVLSPSKELQSTNSHLLELGSFLENYFINPITFIHYNEYLVVLEKGCIDYKQRLEISMLQVMLLSAYYIWRNSLQEKLKIEFQFDEIIYYFFKYSIINTLELVINAGSSHNFSNQENIIISEDLNLIKSLLKNLMKIIFEIELNSKEI
jgi:hypothetical protein